MVYFIYSNQSPTIKHRIDKIVKEKLIEKDDLNYIRFDANEVLVQNWVDEANYVPLGYERKIVVADNCYFLLKSKPKNKIESEQDYETLLDFINNPSDQCDLILTLSSLNISTTQPVYKALKENGTIIEIPDLTDEGWRDGVKTYCVTRYKLKIDKDAIDELAERTAGDVGLLQNSVAILSLYTDHITREDVMLMVAETLTGQAYLISNYLMHGQNAEALKLFRRLRVSNTEPVTLITMLEANFRMLNQIFYLHKNGASEEEIAKTVGISVKRVYPNIKNLSYINEKAIHRALNDLFELDLQIKSGQVDRFYAFEMFLINFKRK